MTPREKAGVETYFAVVNSTGRRFHIGPDQDEAIEVAIRLEAQLRGSVGAAAVGGPSPTVADLPEHTVVEVKAPSRVAVAEAVEQGVPLPGSGSETGSTVTGNEVDERRAAEAAARVGDEQARVDAALSVPPETPDRDRQGTKLEPRPEVPPPGVETFATRDEDQNAIAGVRERDPEAEVPPTDEKARQKQSV